MCSKKINKCTKLLYEQGLEIAFIESATSGRMCSEFSLTEFSGEILRGGLVCYSVPVKEQILMVPHETIAKFTPESEEVTEALARGGKKIFKTEVIVAVTGLLKKGGSESKQKPVGTMFLHIIIHTSHIMHREVFKGTPSEIILQTIERTADIISSHLTKM